MLDFLRSSFLVHTIVVDPLVSSPLFSTLRFFDYLAGELLSANLLLSLFSKSTANSPMCSLTSLVRSYSLNFLSNSSLTALLIVSFSSSATSLATSFLQVLINSFVYATISSLNSFIKPICFCSRFSMIVFLGLSSMSFVIFFVICWKIGAPSFTRRRRLQILIQDMLPDNASARIHL